MGKLPALMIILSSSLLFVLQNLEVVNAAECYGSLAGNNSYAQNRKDLFSNLTNKVLTNGGFYNASLGQYPNRVYALGLCARGFKPNACSNCVEKLAQETERDCPNIMDSFVWGGDEEELVSCLVRSSNRSFGNLETSPPKIGMSPDHIGPLINMTLFMLQWESTVNRTLEAATKANTSSAQKYYSASYAEFTAFPNVYMLMQCTPDITSQDCKQCLEACLKYFREQFRGRTGGMATFPSCYFRWDLYTFHGAFLNVTRVPALPRPPPQEKESSIPHKKGRSMLWVIITIIVVLTFINVLVFIGFYKVNARRRKINNGKNVGGAEYSDSDGQFMLRYDLGMILSATNDFSPENKLGQGGFGTVYKGKLLNGKEIAVKRLARGSEGGIEFKNEVSLLTRLQHKNLVKLLGFCNEGDEEILVYEFVPHSSLDRFIFDEKKRLLLTWEVRFKIIEGIARGLVYLHEDSQLKIIHRDLKASNILLDAEMNPKVADFGTARLFDTDETRAETKRIAGTRGYMSPEYLNHGQISAKSDVYSFGVVLLEMISGQRNNSFEGEGIAAFAWKRWSEGKPEIIIDPLLVENPSVQIIKLIQTGLLCVQEDATKRPTMSSVMVWLGSETITIPSPKAPAFTESYSQSEDGTMSMSIVFSELSSR
ncbi:putative cysteine-rich receptor-like protein kinase 39 [Raphanus sativus]|uniref:Cysteine-rich receptor-like protein kinase 40 isoform X2 n=1 Tax=Raphanus sativus TaxID=3726 RepID=A0A6J0MT22_RAPSA|nr:cysteine-rich receptor-like protein kinase 40 isoform X2 [Raphanus sativus]KAJ4906175.1 putative cysteine-rich receptor-like protein kinase 39 [Raphanus sativus]